MAKMILPTNFQDDIMNVSMNGKRRYRLINNADGTVSLEDVTTYDQVGSAFGSGQINQTNTAVNESADKNKIIDSLATINATTQPGYMAGALALKAMSGGCKLKQEGNDFYIIGADSVRKKLDNRSGVVVKLTTTGTGSAGGTQMYLTINEPNGTVIYSQGLTNAKENSISYIFP